ncbi:MAG: polynucleotide adenylyltransferase, partial [Gammaproteobacteria bacterium]|nr:polynucleotide adenylyltransferase [Gammaproteobacteria bacterium]
LKLPNAVSQLARHAALTHKLLDSVLSGSNVLHWLERLDGWRKPAQVEEQLVLVNVLAPEQVTRLDSAWQAARKVSPQALIAEGYQGAALGEALRERRGQAVAAALA